MNKRQKSTFIATLAMLSAVAFVLMYLEISVPFMPYFIKFDFSDIPALLGAFAYGPLSGVIICFLKNAIHLAVSQSMFIGEISNFILGVLFVVPAGIIYKHKKTKKNALIGAIVGAVTMSVLSVFSNYFLTYPMYYAFMPEETVLKAYQVICPKMKDVVQCLIVFNMPFTLLKGIVDTVICTIIYKPLSRFIKSGMGEEKKNELR